MSGPPPGPERPAGSREGRCAPDERAGDEAAQGRDATTPGVARQQPSGGEVSGSRAPDEAFEPDPPYPADPGPSEALIPENAPTGHDAQIPESAPAGHDAVVGQDGDAAPAPAPTRDDEDRDPARSSSPAEQALADAAGQPAPAGSSSDDRRAEEDGFEQALRLAEALVFSSAAPVGVTALSRVLPEGCDPDAVIVALRARYAGRGVELVEVAGGVQFRTALDLAPQLRRVIEAPRRLPRVAMETLAIVAYHQPVTRPEIEDIRGASLSQQTLDALLEANLITPMGRRDSPGRPTLWGTTPQFLSQFGLTDIRDLPRRADLLVEDPQPASRPGLRQEGGGSGAEASAQPSDQQASVVANPSDQAAPGGGGPSNGGGSTGP